MALDQAESFAVPGNPLDGRATGTNDEGAHLVETAKDILDFFQTRRGPGASERKTFDFQSVSPDPVDEGEVAKARGPVLEALGYSSVTVDEIIRSCQLCPAVAQTVLLELELAGRLERQPGQRVSLLRESE